MHLPPPLNITHHISLANEYQFINHSTQKITAFWHAMQCNAMQFGTDEV
jgi:hypothetical protein